MKLIIILTAIGGLFWWFFLREADCGCKEHKDTIGKRSSDCGCNKNLTPAPTNQPAAVVKNNFIYTEPESEPNGELMRALYPHEEELMERGTYKSAFGDEGDAGESETYE